VATARWSLAVEPAWPLAADLSRRSGSGAALNLDGRRPMSVSRIVRPDDQLPLSTSTSSCEPPDAAEPSASEFVPYRELQRAAAETAAFRQLQRCFPDWTALPDYLLRSALERLAANEPVDPNDPDTWSARATHAYAVMRRHGVSEDLTEGLTDAAGAAIVAAQRQADADAGLDWSRIAEPAESLDAALAHANGATLVDFDDPDIWVYSSQKRAAVGRRLKLPSGASAEDLSAFVVDEPDRFDPDDVRSWGIGSAPWTRLVREQFGDVSFVEQPVGVGVVPAPGGASDRWRLLPAFSPDMVRLILQLGGTWNPDSQARVPGSAAARLLAALNPRTVDPLGGVSRLGERVSAAQRSNAMSQRLGFPVSLADPKSSAERWGRLIIERREARSHGVRSDQLHLSIATVPIRGYRPRDLGRTTAAGGTTAGRELDLGEAVELAVRHGLPLMLSSRAAGKLAGRIRVGRMAGRPALLTITSADGLSARTERLPVDRAIGRLRSLRGGEEPVVLDGGARETLRMALARPLGDDPVLLGRQADVTAVMVVGSGVNASVTGTGKTIETGRALSHRAASTRGFRGLLATEGRLVAQWREALVDGEPDRDLPPLCPNARVEVVTEDGHIAARLRRLDRAAGDEGLVLLVSRSMIERFRTELAVLKYHLLVVDEGHKYANPAIEAHRELRALRFDCVEDCWFLTATPRGKTSEHLDILVGLALRDAMMIDQRPNVREGGDLMNEMNAHRVRASYGPHLVRLTRRDMAQYMPQVRPATALPVEPDPALRALLEEIRRGGRAAYGRLLQALAHLRRMPEGGAAYKDALAEVARAQGVVLGNVGVYFDASVDPETLLHSRSPLAIALVRQGLVQPAMRGGGDGMPLLRSVVAETLAATAGKTQSLVFAEHVHCLHQLARALRDRHGVDARVGDGSVREEDFTTLKRAFLAGEFPILCLSAVGQEGHNLQNASLLCNYDFPWVPRGLAQRLGRVDRIGSRHPFIETINPYISPGAIEHVIAVLAPRSAEDFQLLDSPEGLRAHEAPVAGQLAEITAQVAASKQAAGYAGTAARLRFAAAVFGAG
jgi:hypothetical protein